MQGKDIQTTITHSFRQGTLCYLITMPRMQIVDSDVYTPESPFANHIQANCFHYSLSDAGDDPFCSGYPDWYTTVSFPSFLSSDELLFFFFFLVCVGHFITLSRGVVVPKFINYKFNPITSSFEHTEWMECYFLNIWRYEKERKTN